MSYLENLEEVAARDVDGLKIAERSYGDSWKKRGGVGAFMMLARKWDRIQEALEPRDLDSARQNTEDLSACLEHNSIPDESGCPIVRGLPGTAKGHAKELRKILEAPVPYDIFDAIERDERSEGIIDDIRDLRRYLLLVEAEMMARGSASANSTHRDNA